jgi:glycosyltransferase involved in cell wall biosynthesis
MELQRRIMKIIIVIPSLNMLGGAQRVCLHTIKALRKTGCKIVLSTIVKTDWALVEEIFGEASKPDELHYLFSRMPEMPILALKQAFVALSYVFHLFTITTRNKNDLVINMGGEIVDSLGDIVYVNAIPLRLMHLFPEIQPKQGVRWRIYSRLFSMFLKVLGDSAGTIVANSRFTQAVIEKYVRKKVLVVNPPVNSQKIKSHGGPGHRKNTIVTVSRFRSAKGLAIIPQIAVFLKDCEFVLIGIVDSSSESCLKELSEEIERLQVRDRVHIFKNKPYNFTLKVLSTAKVFLNTQTTEAFGMSIVESMAAGCVPVVPRAGGPWLEILDRQEGLYGFSYKSPREAAEKIGLLIDDESLRREISARAAERAMIFDSSAFEKKFLNLVETISSHGERLTR